MLKDPIRDTNEIKKLVIVMHHAAYFCLYKIFRSKI